MAFFQNSPPQEKNKTHELNNVSVMASKGLGRVWSFNINFWVLLGILAALVLNFVFSSMLLIWYFDEHHQKNLLGKLEQDFQQTQKALYQAKQRLKFLENYIDPSKIPTESPKERPNLNRRPGNPKQPRSEAIKSRRNRRFKTPLSVLKNWKRTFGAPPYPSVSNWPGPDTTPPPSGDIFSSLPWTRHRTRRGFGPRPKRPLKTDRP